MAEEWDLPANVQTTNIERLGGFTWESGVYPAVISLAYLTKAKSGAIGFNIVMKNTKGKELKETFWIRSGDKKDNKTYYTKDGKDFPLPGYSVANSLCVAITGDSLPKCMTQIEKKVIKVYDGAAGGNIEKECPVLMKLIGANVTVAVHQISEDKTSKNDATGQYEKVAGTRTKNECKFFGNSDGKTAEEIMAGKDSEIFDKWAEKNTGNVIDKTTKGTVGASAADIVGSATAVDTAASTTKSLF